MRVAAVITNYNMPERTDALCRAILERACWPVDLIVVDNGSDLTAPSQFTTVALPANVQTTGGWLAGLEYADQTGNEYFAYWFLITSAEFPQEGGDPLSPMAALLQDSDDAVGVHPALTTDSTTAWKHLITRGGNQPRRTWMIDNIASLYRADWFDSVGRFDPALTYAWGIDLETCYLARKEGRSLWIDERVQVRKVTDIGYAMGRMNMSAEQRRQRAGQNMAHVLSGRYGSDWWKRMTKEYTDAI